MKTYAANKLEEFVEVGVGFAGESDDDGGAQS